MKRIFTLLMVFAAFASFAQLTLIQEDVEDLIPFWKSDGTLMYFEELDNNEGIMLYNSDFSMYKSIDFPDFPFDTATYENYYSGIEGFEDPILGEDQFYITDGFINTDEKLEFIISMSGSTDNWTERIEFFYVMDEDGNLIKEFEGNELSAYAWDNLLMIADYIYDHSDGSYSSERDLYQVGGFVPCNTCSGTGNRVEEYKVENIKTLNAYPNPSKGFVTLEYELPEEVQNATIKVFDMKGSIVDERSVNNQSNRLILKTSQLDMGIYNYQLYSGSKSIGAKKVVVIK